MAGPSRRALGLAAAGGSGIAVAVQSKINGELGEHLHDGYVAALISFAGGLVLIGVITAVQPTARRGLPLLRTSIRQGRISRWHCLGGVFGAALVASQSLTVATLGVALFTVAVVAGQSVSSLAVDRAGLGTSGRQPVTGRRLFGAVLTVVAVIVAVAGDLGAPATLALALLPAVAGAGSAVQQAVNGRVRAAAASVTAATFVNFIVGTTVLAIAVLIDLAIRGAPTGTFPWQPWLYAGGVLGVLFIAVAAAIVHELGVLLLGLAMIAGQLVGSIAIDFLLPGAEGRPGANTLLGVALTFVAVGVAATKGKAATTGKAAS